jgi:high-affinity iron transporter
VCSSDLGSVLGGLERELAEGIAAIAAAAMLLGVTHWLLGQLTAKRFMGFVGGQLNATIAGSSAKLGVMSLSFVAAYREAFELVLFFQALMLDAGDAKNHVWLGVLIGGVVLAAATFALKAVGQRLQPRPFMLASSALLALLAVVLIGKGVRALQEAGAISISNLGSFEIPTLGIFATTQGLLAQGLLIALLAASALWAWRQDRHATQASTPTAAE